MMPGCVFSAQSAVRVVTTQVQAVNIPQVVRALGSLSAINQTMLSSDVDGRIVQILYESGRDVGKNMPIIQLDARRSRSAYQQTVTDYRLAEVKYHNAKLLEDEAVSTQEIQILKAALENKFAIMQSAQVALNQLTITSPIAGTLGILKVSTGDFIKAGQPLVQITDTKQLQVQYQIPEAFLGRLKLGQLVTITSSVYPGKVFYGTVSYISPTIDQATRAEVLQASIDNSKGQLRPGVFVTLEQKLGMLNDALVIPEVAVLADVQGYYVYRVQNKQALKSYITEGERYNRMVTVSSGLKKNDVVVTQGQQKLQDGMSVQVLQPGQAEAGAKSQ
jgi:membrane fusion protein (multidrug efflux system)